jgi:hypothetical protein
MAPVLLKTPKIAQNILLAALCGIRVCQMQTWNADRNNSPNVANAHILFYATSANYDGILSRASQALEVQRTEEITQPGIVLYLLLWIHGWWRASSIASSSVIATPEAREGFGNGGDSNYEKGPGAEAWKARWQAASCTHNREAFAALLLVGGDGPDTLRKPCSKD